MRASDTAFGSSAATAKAASDRLSLRKQRIPTAHPFSARTPNAFRLAAEPRVIPLRGVMDDQGVLGRKHPPFAFKCQEPALHVSQDDVLAGRYLADVLVQPGAKVSFALGQFLGCLADINQLVLPVQPVDAAELRGDTFDQGEQRDSAECFDKLLADGPVKV